MNILTCKTNHITNPLGFAMRKPVVSWIADSDVSKKQTAARILTAADAGMTKVLYDSGKRADISSLAAELPLELKPRTRYYWTVTAWGDGGDEGSSGVNWFETGKMEESWDGQWITPTWKDSSVKPETSIHPYIRKRFAVGGKIVRARLYATGLGLYELELNGRRVGNEYLTPDCTAYDQVVQVHTYDVTELLTDGENVIAAMLGNGWAKARFGTFGPVNVPYTDRFALVAELWLLLEDGTELVIPTDASWKCMPSPVIEDSIYDGEVYDARKEITLWSSLDCDDAAWSTVRIWDGLADHPERLSAPRIGRLQDRLSLPVFVKETFKPRELIHTPAGEWVLDLGQNIAGWLRIRIHEKAGTQIKISFGETLQQGNFYRDNLRSAKAEYVYISNGSEAVVEPHFTFYGFRYAKLEGFSQPLNIDDFTACVVYSDLGQTGNIVTSDPLVNRLFQNAVWGQKGNFLDIPTDCPQRDERMGWTGDAQVFACTASFNMETYAFFTKFLNDVWGEQQTMGGKVPHVAPLFMNMKEKSSEPGMSSGGSAAWGDAAVIIPWTLYLQYGDKAILERQYESMKAWVDWIRRRDIAAGDHKLWLGDSTPGDWLALDGDNEQSPAGGTDTDFISSVYYKNSTEILSKTAAALGKSDDAAKYHTLAEEIKKAIRREFFSQTGRSTINTQTAYVLVLQMNLLPEDQKGRAVKALLSLLEKNNMHLKTGFVGTPFLCRVLSSYGFSEAAYDLFFQEDYPSWLYQVKMGATTIWERWNSILPDGRISGTVMNSLNHYSYGSIAEWMYRHMAGIQPLDDAPGFARFIIRPEFDKRLSSVHAWYDSAMGRIECRWERDNSGIMVVQVRIPFNTNAVVYLPDADRETAQGFEGIVAIQDGTAIRLELEAGSYRFTYPLTRDYGFNYSIKSTVWDLLSRPEPKAVLDEYLPMLGRMPPSFGPNPNQTLEQVLAQFGPMLAERFGIMIDAENLDKLLKNVTVSIRQIAN
jgi:alpha-L-rhamnosidase